MGQVSVTLNGRTYRLSCDDGEEPHLLGLVAHVRTHMDQLVREHGQVGDDRLLLMTSLLVADELHDARAVANGKPASPEPKQTPAASLAPQMAALDVAAARLPLRPPASAQPAGAPPMSAGPSIPAAPMLEQRSPASGSLAAMAITPKPVSAPVQASTSALAPSPKPATATPTTVVEPRLNLPARPPADSAALPAPATQPAPAAAPPMPRAIEAMDATALMKGLERKIGRP